MDEEIIKSNLRFRNGTSGAVKLGHYNGQTLSLLFLGLQNGLVSGCLILWVLCVHLGKVLLCNPLCPHATEAQGPGGITNISTLYQHPFDHHRVHRDSRAGPRLGTRDAGSLSSRLEY